MQGFLGKEVKRLQIFVGDETLKQWSGGRMGQITQAKKYFFSLSSGVVYTSPLPFNNHNSNPLLISYPSAEKAGVLFCFYSNNLNAELEKHGKG